MSGLRKVKSSKMTKGQKMARKGSNFLQNFFEIAKLKLKFIISLNILDFVQICPKRVSKCTIFFIFQKDFFKIFFKRSQKNGQSAKPFYFWQTVSKRPNGNPVFYSTKVRSDK